MRGDARPFGESGTYFCDCGVMGSVSASFLRRVKTVSNPTPAVTATSSADTNWILSAGWTVGAVVLKTPGAPTHCGIRYASPTTMPAAAPSRREAAGAVCSAPQKTERISAPVAPAAIRPEIVIDVQY